MYTSMRRGIQGVVLGVEGVGLRAEDLGWSVLG